MAKRTLNAVAKLIADRMDISRDDVSAITFIENMLVVTLQEIVATVPYAQWLLDQDTISTVASQPYATLTADLDIDSIINIIDTTNNYALTKITPEEANLLDPGRDLTGYPRMWWHQIVSTGAGSDRIYFEPIPDAVYTLTAMFGNLVDDIASTGTSALPAKYEGIWMDLTIAKVYERFNPEFDTSRIEARGQGGFNSAGEPTGLARIIWDAKRARPSGSLADHRPNKAGLLEMPSFPADYNIL